MYKRSFAFLLSLAFIISFSCSGDSPLTPEDSAEPTLKKFPFFPLSRDFTAVYKYVSKDNPDSPRKSPFEEWQALLRLEVIRAIQKEEAVFYKIEKTVLFPVEGYAGDLAEMNQADIDHSRTIVQEYDILFQDSTLWYVDNAPSFERLDEGIKTYFYIYSDEGESYIFLTIFGIPDKYPLKDVLVVNYWPLMQEESEGLIIKRYLGYRAGICDMCEVFVWVKEKTGVISIFERRSQSMISYEWGHRYEIELIE